MLGFTNNLLLVSKILDNNMKVEFDPMHGEKICFVQDKFKDFQIVDDVEGHGKMFLLDVMDSNN